MSVLHQIGVGCLIYLLIGMAATEIAHIVLDLAQNPRPHYWPWQKGFWIELQKDAAWGFGWPYKLFQWWRH